MDLLFFSVLCLLCLCARLFICALWSHAGKGLTSWLSFVVSYRYFVTFPLVSLVKCGTWLYRFLIFVPLLTFYIVILSPGINVFSTRTIEKKSNPADQPSDYWRFLRECSCFIELTHMYNEQRWLHNIGKIDIKKYHQPDRPVSNFYFSKRK